VDRQDELARIRAEEDALFSSGRHDERRALLRRAVWRFPDESELLVRSAVAERGHDDTRAAELSRRAIETGAENLLVMVVAGAQLFDLGYHDEAERAVEAAGPLVHEGSAGLARFALLSSQILAAKGQLEEAEEGLRKGFGLEPENPEWGYILARVLLAQGRAADALDAVRSALQHRPDASPLVDLESEIRAMNPAE
jgi:tetratricopeptide (TPR) repeat protein